MFKLVCSGMVCAVLLLVITCPVIQYGFAADDAMTAKDEMSYMMTDSSDSHMRFDVDSIESRVQAAVIETLMLYWEEGPSAFDMIMTKETIHTDVIYTFVLNAETFETVAHGAFPDFTGVIADTLFMANSPTDHILADLERDGGTWVEYMSTNPANGLVQPKRSWLYLHDGYIFGSGHYLPESTVKHIVEDAVRLYESEGERAFDIITPEESILTTELYSFVFDATTLETVAHGAIPDRLGHRPYSILDTGDRPVEHILTDLEQDGGTWVEYVFTNPATETKQLKRSWLYQHDGYIFSAGYYLQDSRIQSLVKEAIILHMANGEASFDIMTPDVADPLSLRSSFVLDASTLEVLAHGLLPDLVGSVDQHLMEADKSLEQIMTELHSEDGVWVWYMAQNPATLTEQLTRAYLSLRGDYIFGAGYSLPDSRIQSMVDEAIYTYKNDPESGFDVINSGTLNRIGIYPLARNTTHIVAHGTLPHIIGPLPDVQVARSYEGTWNAAVEGGGTVWSQYSFVSPYTDTDQIKRAWLVLHDGYLFGSTYNVPDADTQSVVDYAIFIYEHNREDNDWIDIITPEQPIVSDDLYSFIFNATDLKTVAHGAIPDRIGHIPYAITDTADRPIDDIIDELAANGNTWTTYTFLNPSTGTDQLKRTYLQMRDGLIFASGYYILDSQVQAIAYNQILEYNHNGRDKILANLDAIPEVPVSTYAFVVDPETSAVLAQNVNPRLLDQTSDWDIISQDLSLADIMDQTHLEGGIWAEYGFMNPVTGNMEDKRSWLIFHDGLVFGSGYYSSDQ